MSGRSVNRERSSLTIESTAVGTHGGVGCELAGERVAGATETRLIDHRKIHELGLRDAGGVGHRGSAALESALRRFVESGTG